jgi:peptidoglycan/LPS O-acetylase OafA/YrhL
MTTITPTLTTTPDGVDQTTRRSPLWRAGAVSGVVAALATTLVVVAARAADVPVAVDDDAIPLAGFAQLTLVGAVIGVVLATCFARRAARPRHSFTVTTVALTALSLVPDLVVDATVGSKFVLMLTHVVAAAVVVPALAARLER